MKRRFWALFGVVLMAVVVWPRTGTAAPMGIYLSTNTPTVPQNSTFEVQVRTNSTFEPNVVQANLSYDVAMLEYQSISTAGTHYEMGVEESGGNGSVRIARATFNAAAGDFLVATVTFKALGSAGATQITFDGDSAMTDSVTTDTTTHPIIISFGGAVAATPVPTPVTTKRPRATAQPTSGPAAPADSAPPEITNASISEISMVSAKISWHTNELTTGFVAYGNSELYGNTAESTEAKTEHAVTLDPTKLQPMTLYNYKIVAKDAAGNEASLPNRTFTTFGVPITVRITDHTNQPLAAAIVLLSGTERTTNDKGEVKFVVAAGTHDANITYGDTRRLERFTVLLPASVSDEQVFAVTLRTPVRSVPASVGIGLGAIAGLSTLVFLVIKFAHRPKPPRSPGAFFGPQPPPY